jgi:hypothetical protein
VFARAIVHDVPDTFGAGTTIADLVPPDAENTCEQHRSYVADLEDGETVGRSIAERGYEVTGMGILGFRRLDGGLSCLSLRLPELEP